MSSRFPYRLRLLLFLVACLWLASKASSQQYNVYSSLTQLEERLRNAGDTTIVLNFWATWCKPCVEELASFEQLTQTYADKKVKVILLSLDFKSQVEKKFIPFLQTKQLKSEVVLFADQEANTWIPRIHESWDGAIPATLVVQGPNARFAQGKFEDFTSLEAFVKPFIPEKDSTNFTNKTPLILDNGR